MIDVNVIRVPDERAEFACGAGSDGTYMALARRDDEDDTAFLQRVLACATKLEISDVVVGDRGLA